MLLFFVSLDFSKLLFYQWLNFGGVNVSVKWDVLIGLQICGHQLEVLPHSDGNNIFSGNDIFSGLGDLDYDCRLSEGAMSYYECDYLNQSFLGDNTSFLELHDLDTPLDGPVNAGIF